MKSWLEKNDIEIYSTHNEGKIVIAERFISMLNNKSNKYTISEKLAEHFMKKELQKTNQKEFRVKKIINRKGDKLYGKDSIIRLIAG